MVVMVLCLLMQAIFNEVRSAPLRMPAQPC